ncbi:hypothetical protein TrVFT333_004323 [Trichoderma virens FT-333]|nr:hypothetical protein TrVFT333_004323 [Trichoderma virens FT-333]
MAVTSSPLKPHILLIPGAWHPGSTLDTFVRSLEAAGFSAEAVSLRSVGTAGISVQDDEAQVKAVLTPLVDEGRNVLIVAHSDKAETEGLLYTLDEEETFYNDCSAEIARSATAMLKPHSVRAMQSAPSAVGWQDKSYDGRRAYIRCLKDNALPVKIQDHLVARSGVEWAVKTLDSSHSPFLSMPDELTRTLEEIIEEFAKN